MSHETYDVVIIGAGMGGLTVGSLLARAGARVCVLEAHEYPGGCAHSFPMGDYTFCAAVHYIFYCGEGEPVYNFLRKLGLQETVTFNRLDPEGYDHFRCPTENLSFRIPNGLDKWRERMIDRFPGQRGAIRQFFHVIGRLADELRQLPHRLDWRQVAWAPIQYPHVLRYRRWTLQRLFDALGLPADVQAVLATQVGDLGLPPAQVSLPIYAALVWSYGNGAYHPVGHFQPFIESIARVIDNSPGCRIDYCSPVNHFDVEQGQIAAVHTEDGRMFRGNTVIVNIDPRRCVDMIGRQHFSAAFLRRIDYRYSVSSFTLYLGVRGIDLRDHGFGNYNVWHYPDLEINRAYRRQTEQHDLSNPWLFLSTPTLYGDSPTHTVCPAGEQILEAVTVCNYEPFRALRDQNPRAYHREKKKIAERIIDVLVTHYVPGLRNHIVMKVAGSPVTNERFLWAPDGNIYGSELTPANVDFHRLKFDTPIPNLYLTGASAEFPSIGGTVLGGCRLYTHLTGDPVNPGRDCDQLY